MTPTQRVWKELTEDINRKADEIHARTNVSVAQIERMRAQLRKVLSDKGPEF